MEFPVTREFPLVSLVAMLAPSPDWFVGVAALGLCEDAVWVAERRVELFAHDAGTDSGRSYEAPDADTQPREPIRRIEASPFRVAGGCDEAPWLVIEPEPRRLAAGQRVAVDDDRVFRPHGDGGAFEDAAVELDAAGGDPGFGLASRA